MYFAFIRKVGRIFYGKNIWLISDRETMAGDNGEALFKYLQDKPVKTYFAISKNSKDYARIGAIGKVVDYGSLYYKFLLCVADVHLSSQTIHMENHEETYQVFLQHGVAEKDISFFLNDVSHKNFFVITTGAAEKESFEEPQYVIQGKHVWLTGLPRHDLLYNEPDKRITISLTWRKYLINEDNESIKNSLYYKAYDALLNDEELLDVLEQYGYKLCFKLHPEMGRFSGAFHFSDRIEVWDACYTDIFAKSELLVTDYSSIVFDFALLDKPVIYYQFDEDSFWQSELNYAKGYFDYRRDGFGEVVTDHKVLKQLIISYVKSGCAVKPEYRKRVNSFFAYRDKSNSERVYNKVLELLKK